MNSSINEITSNKNKYFKRFKSLNMKKYRESERLYLLEGQRYIDTAIELKLKFEALLFDIDSWNQMELKAQNFYLEAAEVFVFPSHLFKEITQTEQSQGFLGVINMPEVLEIDFIEKSMADKTKLNILLLDRVQDPGNLGTIIRTADAAGIEFVLLAKGTVDAYSPKVVRSTAGSILNIKLIALEEVEVAISELKTYGFNIIATALEGAKDYGESSCYKSRNCLIIGNEANGVSAEILNMADNKVKIPIFGKAESLNAAVAAGIMMYKLNSL
ncbi:RNA methyltransferase [Fusibacter bizertensis]|uniref:RNA methyltransferase n=1 Tax=Fusibacter bizertensis TaxID=1488331 RepID=A0ABT6NAX4_9FIRM|nr:RNA methyltransferase [Fusibacter bizertensis]MDH8677569.1 RNA methyltransferase [Fusibacter bizertensis]